MAATTLPPCFDGIDIGSLSAVPPESLFGDPAPIFEVPLADRAAASLKYSRAGPGCSYDEIGFRLVATCIARGAVPLETLHGVRLARARERNAEVSDPIAAILEEEQKLRHRLFDLPEDSGRFSYRVEGRLLQLERKAERAADEQTWTFPLSAPLSLLRHNAEPSDAPQLLTQRYRVDIPGSFWLPLSTLVAHGRMRRYQDWRAEVCADTRPGNFYAFVSHRWLAPKEPDPQGTQAAFLAWQMTAHLCDAVRIAHYRGLDQPRLRSPTLGFTVGITGSDLAEALLVNVLRPALDAASLATAWEESRSLQSLIEDNGAAAAAADAGLARLRDVLAGCPTLSRLVDRIHVWYDYACLPQPPRTPEDEALFRRGLESLVAIQVLGHTVVLLDEAEDYLSRGWCTLEALVADTVAVSMALLIGSARKTARDGTVEHCFEMLLQDRPHIVWRAVLDTEVFRTQGEADCVERLALKVTDPKDLPFIYRQLRSLAAPTKIHVDASELFTGAYPVAQRADGTVVVPAMNQRGAQEGGAGDPPRSLDWTAALGIASGWTAAEPALPQPFLALPRRSGRKTCHVAVVAACEGEAAMWSTWSLAHREALEAALDVELQSMSWLAADIAPVGHVACGTLQPVPVQADLWVLVATRMRTTHCDVTAALCAAVAAAGVPVWALALDERANNLAPLAAMPASATSTRSLPVTALQLQPRTGGAFRSDLLDRLFGGA